MSTPSVPRSSETEPRPSRPTALVSDCSDDQDSQESMEPLVPGSVMSCCHPKELPEPPPGLEWRPAGEQHHWELRLQPLPDDRGEDPCYEPSPSAEPVESTAADIQTQVSCTGSASTAGLYLTCHCCGIAAKADLDWEWCSSCRGPHCRRPQCLTFTPDEVCPVCAGTCLLYTSPSPRDLSTSRMPSSA